MSAEWVRVDLADVEKYGADAAVVLGLIAYRCAPTGEWQATLSELTDETRLTAHRVRGALRVLRDTGAVTSHRADRFHPTLTWGVSAGHAVNADSVITRLGVPSLPESADSVITSIQEPLEELPPLVPPVPATAKVRKRAHRLPDDFRPDPAHWTLAQSLGVDLRAEGPKFVDYHTAKGSTMKDWPAALRTWIRNAASYAARDAAHRTPDPAHRPPPKRDLYG